MIRRTYFLIGFLLQFLLVFGLYVPYVIITNTGTEITLETVPVDPRSIFRGDYVILNYEVAQDITWTDLVDEDQGPPETLYLILEQSGDLYTRVGASVTKPTLTEGQVCLQATSQSWFGEQTMMANIPDLAQYFVEEGTGSMYEEARNTHRLLVHAAVDGNCNAVIKGVEIGPEAPLDEQKEGIVPPERIPTGI